MFSGNISVTVQSASELSNKSTNLNTYVQVKVDDDEIFKTTTARDTANPAWNERQEFDSNMSDQISFIILDENGVIGECNVSLGSLLAKHTEGEALQMREPLTPQGEIHLEILLKENACALKRRKAVEKIYRTRGHYFVKVFFSQPTFCAQDSYFIWGVGKQGMRCICCNMAVHERCHKLILTACPANIEGDDTVGAIIVRDHDFERHTYLRPTFCDQCGTMLLGVVHQGYECKSCSLDAHKECRDLLPATCGVDKLAHAILTSQLGENKKPWNTDKEKAQRKQSLAELIKKNMNLIVKQTGDSNKSKLEDFRFIKTLGQGAFGKVMLAEHRREGKLFALKILSKPQILTENEIPIVFSERDTLVLGSKSKFLTQLHSTFQSSDRIFFVMEYLTGGDLMFHLIRTGKFTEERASFYTAELVLGLHYLHIHGIIYRDLKLENVMLTAEGHVQLVDFGMVKQNMSDGATTNTFCGTPLYIAPEMLSGHPYGPSVDWWALGILLYKMLACKPPFDHDDDKEMYKMIQYRQVSFPSSFSHAAQNIISNLLKKCPMERLGCKTGLFEEEIKFHPFFQSISWTDLEEGKVDPPFHPTLGKAEEANNFESQFTHQPTALSPLKMDKDLKKLAEEGFIGFSFCNEEYDN